MDRRIAVIFGQVLMDEWRTIPHRIPRMKNCTQWLIIYVNQGQSGQSCIWSSSDHHGYRVAPVAHFIPSDGILITYRMADTAGTITARDDSLYAGRGTGAAHVQAPDTCMRVRRAHYPSVGNSPQAQVGQESSLSGDLFKSVDTKLCPTDDVSHTPAPSHSSMRL